MAALLVAGFIQLTGPNGQLILLNPEYITNMRPPRGDGHFTAGTRCLVFTVDGKYISVLQDCNAIRAMLRP